MNSPSTRSHDSTMFRAVGATVFAASIAAMAAAAPGRTRDDLASSRLHHDRPHFDVAELECAASHAMRAAATIDGIEFQLEPVAGREPHLRLDGPRGVYVIDGASEVPGIVTLEWSLTPVWDDGASLRSGHGAGAELLSDVLPLIASDEREAAGIMQAATGLVNVFMVGQFNVMNNSGSTLTFVSTSLLPISVQTASCVLGGYFGLLGPSGGIMSAPAGGAVFTVLVDSVAVGQTPGLALPATGPAWVSDIFGFPTPVVAPPVNTFVGSEVQVELNPNAAVALTTIWLLY